MPRGWPRGKKRGPKGPRTPALSPIADTAWQGDPYQQMADFVPRPPEPLPPEPLDPAKLWHVRKSVDWNLDPAEMPWQEVRCRECNVEMWTRNPEKRDVCEECYVILLDKLQEVRSLQIRHSANRMVNPFRSVDIFHELGGSLPEPKK